MPITRRTFLETTAGAALASGAIGRAQGGADDPLGVRDDFPVTRRGTYLNSAYITPTPRQVVDVGRRFLEAKSTAPVSLGAMLAERDRVRQLYATLIGARSDEVGFLFATTEGENIVVPALDLKAGDNVVIDDLHYTSSFVLYERLKAELGIEVRIVERLEDGSAPVSAFEAVVDGRTRLLSIAWVSHQNGYRHDVAGLAALAHAHDAFLYADAVQAVGMFPIDVRATGIDFFTAGTYKWLLGGYGVAPFFVRRELLDRIRPDRVGFLQIDEAAGDGRMFTSAKKFEYATLGFGAIYQLGAGLEYLERVGVDRIETHAVGLAARLHEGLTARGLPVLTPAGNGSSIVSFKNSRPAAEAQGLFDEAGVEVTIREGGTMVRVAPALFNVVADIDRCLEVAGRL
jgi:selenocysteine lyase/cysteine desulfurase